MVSSIPSIALNFVNNAGSLFSNSVKSLKDDSSSLFSFESKNESSVGLGEDFVADIPQAAKYEQSSWDKTERAAGNGIYDVDSKQGEIGDCGLLSTLRALRNSEAGQKALSDVMKYDAEAGTWSFKFKTKDFEGDGAKEPITITQAEVDEAIAAKRISKGDDDVSATELAVEKYLSMIGSDTENNTKDKTMK